MKRIAGMVAVVLLAMTGVAAQQSRDGVTTVPTGVGVLTGMVTTADDAPVPIARAVVTLSGGPLRTGLLAVTDRDGRFVFTKLPAGRFTLDARKAGFVRGVYGAVMPGATVGVPIAVEGDNVTVGIALTRSAALSGRVVMPAGAPASSIRLQVLRWEASAGGRQLVFAQGAYSVGSDGQYRIGGIPPGEYVLVAYPVGRAERRMFAEETPGPIVSLSPVYAPGVLDPTQAAAVTLGAGQERVMDIVMDLVPTARVEGRVFGPDGAPVGQVQVHAAHGLPAAALPAPAATSADGSFVLPALVPGTYTILARASTFWAQTPVTVVSGGNVQGLHLTLRPGRSVRGRFVSSTAPGAIPTTSSLIVGLVPDDGRTTTAGMPAIAPASNETFEIPGAAPGRYRLEVSVPQVLRGSVFVIGITADGRDVFDDAFVIGLERDIDVAITLTTNPSVLNVTTRNEDGHAVAGRAVVIIPRDPALQMPWSRRVVTARTGPDGVAFFEALPDGAYLVADAGEDSVTAARTPEWFAQIAARATAVDIRDGRQTTATVTIRTPLP